MWISAIGIGHFVASRAIAPHLNCTSQQDGDSPTNTYLERISYWKDFDTHVFYTYPKICLYIDSESKDEPSKPYLSPDFLNVVSPAPTGVFFYFVCVSLFTVTWYCTVYIHAVTFTFYKVRLSVITATSSSPTWYLLIPVSPEILNSL